MFPCSPLCKSKHFTCFITANILGGNIAEVKRVNTKALAKYLQLFGVQMYSAGKVPTILFGVEIDIEKSVDKSFGIVSTHNNIQCVGMC